MNTKAFAILILTALDSQSDLITLTGTLYICIEFVVPISLINHALHFDI